MTARHPCLPPLLGLMLLIATLPAASATPPGADPGAPIDSDWVLHALAKPAPMRTNFVEFRSSHLLKTPLRLSGEYQRPDAATLVRQVRAPYAETTTIHIGKGSDGEATIARAGKPPRTFSLSRVPELEALQASFGALLSGDRELLEKYYKVETDGTRRQWTMTLLPKQEPLAAKLRKIVLFGRGVELRCIESQPRQGDTQRTLLAGAAREAGDVDDAGKLTALCRGAAQ